MIKRPLRNLTAASILAGATHGAIAQTPMPQTPTTKILAVGTFAPGTDMSQVQRILPTELPLGKAHLMTFQLTPIGPLNPLRQLLVPAVPH
jgi:hypothetical protein